MNSVDMLTYRKGVVMQRQIKITVVGDDTIVVDFCELDGHRFQTKYYIMANTHDLSTVSMLGAVTAWIEKDEVNFRHPHLMISEEDM
jgi:hypothetical protein